MNNHQNKLKISNSSFRYSLIINIELLLGIQLVALNIQVYIHMKILHAIKI